MFYLICRSQEQRDEIIKALKGEDILSVFHYLSLHKSPFYHSKHDGRELPNTEMYSSCLLRLPMYYELTEKDVQKICGTIKGVFEYA
jgi:dTDP-4-amino-4,6-dideoxygalactose transaminase